MNVISPDKICRDCLDPIGPDGIDLNRTILTKWGEERTFGDNAYVCPGCGWHRGVGGYSTG